MTYNFEVSKYIYIFFYQLFLCKLAEIHLFKKIPIKILIKCIVYILNDFFNDFLLFLEYENFVSLFDEQLQIYKPS